MTTADINEFPHQASNAAVREFGSITTALSGNHPADVTYTLK
ncbi:hypothetical protein [Polymorphospora sp. NPDC050346]